MSLSPFWFFSFLSRDIHTIWECVAVHFTRSNKFHGLYLSRRALFLRVEIGNLLDEKENGKKKEEKHREK